MATPSASPACPECGWKSDVAVCPSCGSNTQRAAPPQGPRVDPAALLAVHEEDYPGLRDAFLAFRSKEVPRFISATLTAVGVDRFATANAPNGATWIFRRGSAVIVISYDRNDNTITIEAPLVDIRPETEVPLLRAALSAGAKLGSARPARRGDKLLLTMVHNVAALPPPRLAHAVDEVSGAADGLDNILAAEFGGRLLGPMVRKGHAFDLSVLGTPKKLKTITAADKPVKLTPTSSASSSSPSSSSAAPSISAASVSRFLDVVRELQQICLGLGFAPLPDEDEAALHVAGAFRAALAGDVELDATRVLLRQAIAVKNGTASPASMRALYTRLTQDRGHTSTQEKLSIPRIPAVRVKVALGKHFAVATRVQNTAIRRTLLLGGLAELILFADLPPETSQALRTMHANHQAPDTKSVEALLTTIQGMVK